MSTEANMHKSHTWHSQKRVFMSDATARIKKLIEKICLRMCTHMLSQHDDWHADCLFSVFLYSQWDHQERSVKHLGPQPRVVSHHLQKWHTKTKEREAPNKTDSMLCMLGLQHARCSKFKENNCKCIVQMTRVQRVPCFLCIMPLCWNYQEGINHNWLFLRHINWVCSNQSCHCLPR